LRLASFGLGLGLAAALLLSFPAAAAEPSFFDQGRAQAGLEKIFDKADHPGRVLRVVLRPNRLAAEVQDPGNPNHVDSWADDLGVDGKEALAGPRPVELDLAGRGLDARLLPLKPADLAVVAGLAAASVKEASSRTPRRSIVSSCGGRSPAPARRFGASISTAGGNTRPSTRISMA
jgi:hypothetical protein